MTPQAEVKQRTSDETRKDATGTAFLSVVRAYIIKPEEKPNNFREEAVLHYLRGQD